MSPPSPSPHEELLAVCREILDDPARGAADVERIAISGAASSAFPLLTRVLPDLADPDLALIHLERYCRNRPVPAQAEALQILIALFGYSPYLGESLLNDPDSLSDLQRSRRQGPWGAEEYRDALARWLRLRHRDDPWTALRAFKRRANLRIALKDLQRSATLPEVVREISCAADALVQGALDVATAETVARFGRPQSYDDAGRTIDSSMCVIALGKLGGMELNYSSDIDLVFVYSQDGETTGIDGRAETQVTNKEFFTSIAESLSLGLGLISAEGQVFRVDCRLRPGGRDGDLVTSLDAALVYYRSWARLWERQSLIKARSCAGDAELGLRLLAGVEPIVYADPPDPDVVSSVRAMKDRIDADLARRGGNATWDVKLGRGGIREIEFTVQALQMLHGGREPWVRGANTLLSMHRLADKGLLSVSEYGALSAAYTFLREVEHRVQIHRNLQRSSLPSAPREMRMLARAMGYRDKGRQETVRFLSDLEAHRDVVRGLYDTVLGRLAQASFEETPAPDPFLDRMTDIRACATLADAGIRDAAALLGSVKAIARLLAGSALTPEVRRAFRKATPLLLRELARAYNPVRAARNMERFLVSLALEPSQLRAFLSRRELVPPLVRLFAGSQLLSSTLVHRPALVLEEGLDLAITSDRRVEDHLGALRAAAGSCRDGTEFAAMLRVYQRTQLVYIGLKGLSRQAGPASTARALSDLAEAVARSVVERCGGEPGRAPAGFVVLGLGKFGFRELDYSSDLDLVFLYDDAGDSCGRLHSQANRLAAEVMEMLTSITREGALYAVDTRLRPFGGEGELAQPLGALDAYFGSSAGVWELQAFLKARPVAGDVDLGWSTVARIEDLVFERAAREDLQRAVCEMKDRLEREAAGRGRGADDIKLGPGGLSAIHFAIQFLQLRHGIRSPSHKRTTRVLASLRNSGVLDEEAYRVFFTGFRFLRTLQHHLRLIQGRSLSTLPSSPEAMDEIAVAMGYEAREGSPPRGGMLGDLSAHRKRIESVFRRVVDQAETPDQAKA